MTPERQPVEKATAVRAVPATPGQPGSWLSVANSGHVYEPLPTPRQHPSPDPAVTRKASLVHLKPLYTVREAMALLSMSRTVIYEQMRSGRIRSVKEGRARRITANAIEDYVALLERESASTTGKAA